MEKFTSRTEINAIISLQTVEPKTPIHTSSKKWDTQMAQLELIIIVTTNLSLMHLEFFDI